MNRVLDLRKKRFGRLTVISFSHTNQFRQAVWLCRCDCGNLVKKVGNNLRQKLTASCGCLKIESITTVGRKNVIHGHTRDYNPSRTFNSYAAMLQRCYYKKNIGYNEYGNRGIKVCDRWLGKNGFKNFLDDMGERPAGKTLDRLDVDGDYGPNNCQWATPKEQANNRRPINHNRY